MNKKLLLIDLDGVLNKYNGEFNKDFIPKIREGASDFLEELSKIYDIKIFTSRSKSVTEKWLEENDLKQYVSDVTNITCIRVYRRQMYLF